MSKKDEYAEKAKATLDRWNAEIDKIEAKMDEAKADAKINYQKQLKEMRSQRDEAKAKLKQLSESSDDAWDDIKDGFDKAWGKISNAFESATSRFK